MKLFRVFPYDPKALPTERGGALYAPGSTSGRVANPDLYRELYVTFEPESAVAETLGRLPQWASRDFVGPDGRALSLATYEMPDGTPVFNLDSVRSLVELGIERPSDVVARERNVTQNWARKVFALRRYAGVRWWIYYNPQWTAAGLWDVRCLKLLDEPIPLTIGDAAVREAAAAIPRQIIL